MKGSKENPTYRPFAEIEKEKWRQQFDRVIKFKDTFGILPHRVHDLKLFYWLTVQRRWAKLGRLTEEQLRLYKEAGINVLGKPKKVTQEE